MTIGRPTREQRATLFARELGSERAPEPSLSLPACRSRREHDGRSARSIEKEPTPEVVREAKNNPGGWVYAISGKYGPNDAVPPEAIPRSLES